MEGKSFRLSDYGISKVSGFMPEIPSFRRLPDYYSPWEELALKLAELNSNKRTRDAILALPELEVNATHLTCEESWRRAYTVLTFLGQSYIWSEGEANLQPSVPRYIARPWTLVADHLGLPPVMTYASTTLYNWYLIDPTKPVHPNNIAISLTCTGTKDEDWFYLIPLFIEIRSAAVLVAIEQTHEAMLANDSDTIETNLKTVKESIKDITEILNQMYDRCLPDVFYESIRPYQAGSLGLDAFPNGILYEGVDSEPKKYSGASAAQNSCIPAMDIFLGVKHKSLDTEEFLKLQRKHMPRQHREFLEMLEKAPSLKDYVTDSGKPNLRQAYEEAVLALVEFRSQHIVLVTTYIVQPKARLNQKLNKSLQAKGTGGSDFMVFLKTSRNETKQCIDSNNSD